MATLEKLMEKVGWGLTSPTTIGRRNGGEDVDLEKGEDELVLDKAGRWIKENV